MEKTIERLKTILVQVPDTDEYHSGYKDALVDIITMFEKEYEENMYYYFFPPIPRNVTLS